MIYSVPTYTYNTIYTVYITIGTQIILFQCLWRRFNQRYSRWPSPFIKYNILYRLFIYALFIVIDIFVLYTYLRLS